MRSKQWYTKTSRLSNSFANNSIGHPRSCFSNKIIGEVTDGVKSPGAGAEEGRKGFQRERTVGFLPFGLRRNVLMRPRPHRSPNQYFKYLWLGLGLTLTTLCQAQTWSHEQSRGGNLLGPPAVAQIPGSDTLQVFYEGGDHALWTRWRNPDGSWSGEQRLGGELAPGATPFAIQIPNTNYLYVFYKTGFNYLGYNIRDNNGNWLGEQYFAAPILGNPVAVQVPATDQVEVFYQGGENEG